MTMDHKRLLEIAKNPSAALDYEIAQDMASSLGRLGRALEKSLLALTDFDAAQTAGTAEAPSPETRRALVDAAGKALWEFIVQREACGLRDTRQVMRDYRVPADVQNRTGVVIPEPLRMKRPRP
jgi:hypothetical protein